VPRAAGAVGPFTKDGAMRILFIKTHEDTARCLTRFLRGAGHDVTTADGIESAQRLLAIEPFALLLFGGMDPRDGSALDFMPRVKRDFGIPGIVLSGYGTHGEIEHSVACGFAAHLVKPVTKDQLLASVARVAGTAGA
jgi:DNA-binding NtrC family response regulator